MFQMSSPLFDDLKVASKSANLVLGHCQVVEQRINLWKQLNLGQMTHKGLSRASSMANGNWVEFSAL